MVDEAEKENSARQKQVRKCFKPRDDYHTGSS